jgi:acetaldehyde dehydrogenase
MMRNTIYALLESDDVDEEAIADSVEEMITAVQAYVPGYRLKTAPVFEQRDTPDGKKTMVAMLLEVTGAGDYLPQYAGNLDIMTASARQVGETFAQHILRACFEIQL